MKSAGLFLFNFLQQHLPSWQPLIPQQLMPNKLEAWDPKALRVHHILRVAVTDLHNS